MGKCTCHDKKTNGLCVACTIDQMARNNYFPGKWLDTRAFEVEQAYGMGKDRRHNRYLHGTGVTCGLKVKQHPNPACRNRFVLVEPGIGIDCCGREIFVKEEETVDFRKLFLAAWQEAHGDEAPPDDAPHTFQLCIHYAECPTEEVAALFDDCNCDDTALQPNQILETYSFSLKLDPEISVTELQGVELEWANTLNVARAGFAVHDDDAELLYVLAQDTLYVFQTDNYSLTGSHTLPTNATALALSGDGTRLYVALDDNSVHVLDSANLGGASALVNTLTHSALVTRLVVSPADGSLYALSPSNSTVTAWDATINTAGADLTAANLGTVTVGGGAADMVITPDGMRVIVANSADSSLSVIDPADLASGSTTQALSLAPSSLAVASTTSGARLYVADAATPRVQILDAASFSAISAVESLSDALLALAVSPGGRWLYATVSVAGEGQLWVIDTHALEAGDVVIGGNIAIGDDPQQPVLALGDGLVYVPFTGDPVVDTSGGVALVTVTESDCDALFEATLDGCPACDCADEPCCLVLATVTEYIFDADVTDEMIDNLRDRQLLPSTQVLYEVLLCLLNREAPTGGTGEQGPPGQPGQGITAVNVTFVDCTNPGSFSFDPATGALTLEIPRGCDGEDGANGINGTNGTNGTNGQDGQGVDQVVVNFIPCDQQGSSSFVNGILTINLPSGCGDDDVNYGHICAINWNHNQETSRQQLGQGIIVAFDVPVRNGDIHRHTFRVEVGLPEDNQFGTTCWCELPSEQITGIQLPNDCEISEDFEIITGDDEKAVNGAIFIATNLIPSFEYRVTIEGDHIRTLNPATEQFDTALDGNFLRGELPTGDNVEGGRFFSWFNLSGGD